MSNSNYCFIKAKYTSSGIFTDEQCANSVARSRWIRSMCHLPGWHWDLQEDHTELGQCLIQNYQIVCDRKRTVLVFKQGDCIHTKIYLIRSQWKEIACLPTLDFQSTIFIRVLHSNRKVSFARKWFSLFQVLLISTWNTQLESSSEKKTELQEIKTER